MAPPPKLIYPFPQPETSERSEQCEPLEGLFWDLGRATKRGTKKCPDCGYVNGIRSYSCKNTFCNRILKHMENQNVGVHIDAIKIVSSVSRQIYSVRTRKKSGLDPDHPDPRGFVQLPSKIYTSDSSDKLSEVALCFVNHCERSYSILKCHEKEDKEDDLIGYLNDAAGTPKVLNFCVHIEAAIKSLSVAHTLGLTHDLINNLRICDDVKKKLRSLAKSTEGPLVQRVANNVMAIKCFVNSTNPLGYLHFMLETKDDEVVGFRCDCNVHSQKCLHFYACVCAFASDPKLLIKYNSFVQKEFDALISYISLEENNSSYPLEKIKIEILRPDLLGIPNLTKKLQKPTPRKHKLEKKSIKSKEKYQKVSILSDTVVQKPEVPDLIEPPLENPSFEDSFQIIQQINKDNEILSYEDWISSVVERINHSLSSQTSEIQMYHHYNEQYFDDLFYQSPVINVEEVKLEFHIPERFFTKFQSQLYFHYQDNLDSDYCTINTIQYSISDYPQLEQIFSSSSIRLTSFQLIVNQQWPFRIVWRGNLYTISNFGELQINFFRQV